MIERLAALARGGERDLEIRLHLLLADVLAEEFRAEGKLSLKVVLVGSRGENAVVHVSAISLS